ncbi:MAG: ATP-dependent endonuclease [Candidatus Melainabacteria bacterium]
MPKPSLIQWVRIICQELSPIAPASQSAAAASLSIALPPPWHPDETLVFQVPSLHTVAVFMNRLLKFEHPIFHALDTHRRFLQGCIQHHRQAKRLMETLPLPMLEALSQQLVGTALTIPADTQAARAVAEPFTARLISRTCSEWQADRLVRADIHLLNTLGRQDHHARLINAENPLAGQVERLQRLLKTFDQQTGCMTTLPPGADDTAVATAYLKDRALSHPLPWQALFSALDAAGPPGQWATLPHLAELAAHQSAYPAPLTVRPFHLLILVEGETEKLLLPAFARHLGAPLEKAGIWLLSAGGKNQMVGLYQKYQDDLAIPIFVLLDQDAAGVSQQIAFRRRDGDQLVVLADGEFEDLYDPALLAAVINHAQDPHPPVTPTHPLLLAGGEENAVSRLTRLWLQEGWGSFDKIAFAQRIAELLATQPDTLRTPPGIARLIDEMHAHAQQGR